MENTYALQVISTGETILTEVSSLRLSVWWGRKEKKILKSRNRAERFKEAIRAGDVIAGWTDYDKYKRWGWSSEEIGQVSDWVLRGADAALDKRLKKAREDNG